MSAAGVSIFGAMQGALGKATIVPGVIWERMWLCAAHMILRAASVSALVTFDAACMRSALPSSRATPTRRRSTLR